MRKIFPYLLLFYLLTFVGLGVLSLLKPPPPPKPPSAWELTWREHGSIVAYATIVMLSMIEVAVGLFFLGGVFVLLKKGWTVWAHTVGRSGGLAPVIRDRNGQWLDVNPEGAVLAAAIAAHAPKVTASMAKNMMGVALDRGLWSTQNATHGDVPIDVSYDAVEEFRSDMVDARGHGAQHHIFVGPTGSGKSVAAYSVLNEMKRQQPEATFLIFEPGRVEWKYQAVTGDFDELFDLVAALHEEMRRRQNMLAQHPSAVHAFELGLPPIVFFLEEAGSALDYYKLSPAGAKMAKEFSLYLRNLLREARKTGISVILVDQAAMAETIPTQVLDNVPHVWIMIKGASPKLLRRWGLTDRFRKLQQAGLLEQRPGLSYDYHAGQLVQFPLRRRPILVSKAPDLEEVLVGSRKQRTGGASLQEARKVKAPASYVLSPTKRPDGAWNDDGVRVDRQNVISWSAAMRVYQTYKKLGSINRTQQALFPGQTTGGHWFYWIRDIVEQIEGKPRQQPMVRIVKKSDLKKAAGNGRQSFHHTVQVPRPKSESVDVAVRRLAEQFAKRVPYSVAAYVLKLYKRFGSCEAVHQHLWPADRVNTDRVTWLERIVEQMLRGAPDSYGPVVVVGWPD